MSGTAGTSTPTESQHTVPGAVMGTLSYMSPEQVRGLPVDARTDIFSFGVVLYEMVTQQRPFRGNSAVDVIDAILREEPRDLAGVPVSGKLRSLIGKLLEKKPADRYASADEVAGALRSVAAAFEPAGWRLSRGAWIAITAAVVTLAGASGWYWHRASQERWALETATPEIARLVEAEGYAKAVALAREARAILPKDPTLESLWNRATKEASVESVPAGADVSVLPYLGASDAWTSLGQTPIKKLRVSKDLFVWRVARSGYAAMEWLGYGGDAGTLKLHEERSVPTEMVVVPGNTSRLLFPLAWGAPVKLDDYLIDRHEITNEEYLKFVEAGGYQRREFWDQPFAKDGRALPWEEAISFFRDATGRPGPATWEAGGHPRGRDKHPVSGISWFEAAAYARFAGKSLPTVYHWTLAAAVAFPGAVARGGNYRGGGTQPVGGPGTLSGRGTTDMAGNVKEWCWNEGREGQRFILGGGFGEPDYTFAEMDAHSPWERTANMGVRLVKLLAPAPAMATARQEPFHRDYLSEKPVSDAVFAVYRGLYAYDKVDLEARVEQTETGADWTHEKVTFNAAYGGERMAVHLFLPKKAVPPLQVVVYFPPAGALFRDNFAPSIIEDYGADFFAKTGRALAFPIYRSTFERRDGLVPGGKPLGVARDHFIMWSKDLSRTVDYLETRQDLDRAKLAYAGFSWGAHVAPVMLAVDQRFKVAILKSGGFFPAERLPEADAFNFIRHVRIPVLMLNDRYDSAFPADRSQIPFFRLLGTPDKDKKRVVYDTGHGELPHKAEIRESLDWLDKYLGPVKRQ